MGLLFTHLLYMYILFVNNFAVPTVTEMAGGVIQQLLRRKLHSQSTVSFAVFSHAVFLLLRELILVHVA